MRFLNCYYWVCIYSLRYWKWYKFQVFIMEYYIIIFQFDETWHIFHKHKRPLTDAVPLTVRFGWTPFFLDLIFNEIYTLAVFVIKMKEISDVSKIIAFYFYEKPRELTVFIYFHTFLYLMTTHAVNSTKFFNFFPSFFKWFFFMLQEVLCYPHLGWVFRFCLSKKIVFWEIFQI